MATTIEDLIAEETRPVPENLRAVIESALRDTEARFVVDSNGQLFAERTVSVPVTGLPPLLQNTARPPESVLLHRLNSKAAFVSANQGTRLTAGFWLDFVPMDCTAALADVGRGASLVPVFESALQDALGGAASVNLRGGHLRWSPPAETRILFVLRLDTAPLPEIDDAGNFCPGICRVTPVSGDRSGAYLYLVETTRSRSEHAAREAINRMARFKTWVPGSDKPILQNSRNPETLRGIKFWRPPFTNIYGNGALCTGSLSYNPKAGIAGAAQEYLHAWASNPFNRDLVDFNQPGFSRLLEFDPETLEPRPHPENWRDFVTNIPELPDDVWLLAHT